MGRGEAATLPEEHRQKHRRQQLKHRDPMQLVAERLLGRLVPKQRSPGIGADGAAKEREIEQSRLRHPPFPALSLGFVVAEGGKGEEVNRDQRGDDVGGGEQGFDRDHARDISRKGLIKPCFGHPAPPARLPGLACPGERRGSGVPLSYATVKEEAGFRVRPGAADHRLKVRQRDLGTFRPETSAVPVDHRLSPYELGPSV